MTKTKKPPGSFRAADPKDRLPQSVPLDLHKEVGQPAGIILRAWKKGVLEIRGTTPGSPACAQDIGSHKGWLVVGLNGMPVYSHMEVANMLKTQSSVKINVVQAEPGDIPVLKGNGKAANLPQYDMSNPNPSMPAYGNSMSRSMGGSTRGGFRPNDKVEVYYGADDGVANGAWYPAEVSAKLFDGSYAVTFETGEAAEGVAGHSMRFAGASSPPGPSSFSPRSTDLIENDRIEVFYGPDDDGWYPATIGQRHRDGSYTVHFDTGELSEGVSREYIRPLGDDAESSYYNTYNESTVEPLPPHLGPNSQAEVLWEGRDWTQCVIKAFHPLSNTYDVDWMDGTETLGVLQRDVRPARHTPSVSARGSSPRSWR